MSRPRYGFQGLTQALVSFVRPIRRASSVQYAGALGLLWLLTYVLGEPVRGWTLGLLWRVETAIATPLGLTLRVPQRPPGEPDRLASAAVIGLYVLIWLWLSGQQARGFPSAEELSGADMPARLSARAGASEE